ncbi:MAG TPA: DHA2 family efflux MFS transporter permease subunit [Acidimicrobiales bacterium]|nr:DHA2 family efflux MFS transporter permease subunit [Acidimicrobiales bacterium]
MSVEVVTSANAPGQGYSKKRVALIVAVLALAAFMSSLDIFIVNLAFPYISRDFHGSSLESLSWVLNGYSILFAAVLVPAGRWADRIGRRRMFVAGLVVFTFGSILSGIAPDVALLIVARLVQAIGAGMMVPASLSLLLAAVPGHARAQAIGTWSAIGALGAALGPVIGGFLVEVSWRWVFWINIPVGIVAVVLALKVLPESRDETANSRPDLLGAGLVALVTASLALALVKAPSWGWTSKDFFGLIVLALVSSIGVVLRSSRHATPVVDLTLLESRSFNGAILASISYYAGFGVFLLSMVEFLTGVWHFSAIDAGLAIAPGPLMVLPFARVVAPRLSVKLGGAGRVAVIGCFVNVVAQALWYSRMQVPAAYVTHLLPIQMLGGVGVGLTIPSLIGAGTASIPPARFGTGSGVLNMARQIGTVLGVAGLIAILTGLNPTDPIVVFRHGALLAIGFFALAGVASAALLSRRVTTSTS